MMTTLQAIPDAATRVASSLARPSTAHGLTTLAKSNGTATNTNTARAAATASGAATTASATASGGITSTDFLSLLVSELKNQDPTQPTDPNAYVQQLVGVNSLQQLIQIDQTLGKLADTKPTAVTA